MHPRHKANTLEDQVTLQPIHSLIYSAGRDTSPHNMSLLPFTHTRGSHFTQALIHTYAYVCVRMCVCVCVRMCVCVRTCVLSQTCVCVVYVFVIDFVFATQLAWLCCVFATQPHLHIHIHIHIHTHTHTYNTHDHTFERV